MHTTEGHPSIGRLPNCRTPVSGLLLRAGLASLSVRPRGCRLQRRLRWTDGRPARDRSGACRPLKTDLPCTGSRSVQSTTVPSPIAIWSRSCASVSASIDGRSRFGAVKGDHHFDRSRPGVARRVTFHVHATDLLRREGRPAQDRSPCIPKQRSCGPNAVKRPSEVSALFEGTPTVR